MTHYLGIIGDLLDTPDPYILVHINCAAKKSQKTKHFNNEGRDQLFVWFFDPETDRKLDQSIN